MKDFLQMNYPIKAVEQKWQRKWHHSEPFRALMDAAKPKYFVFCACPYVTGSLHMGHVRSYTMGDVCARYRRMTGYNVLFTMGFDSMGLPAEVAAKERSIHPREWVRSGVAAMKRQMNQLGLSIDWHRSFSTSEDEIFRRSQEMFLLLYRNNYAYRKVAPVNWCPVCVSTLAHRQVENDGTCWRCGTKIEGRRLGQWFYRTSVLAESFHHRLEQLDWPETSKQVLRNWNKKSDGLIVTFAIDKLNQQVVCFTTTPEFLYTINFIAISPEHSLVRHFSSALSPDGMQPNKQMYETLQAFIQRYETQPPYAFRASELQIDGCFTDFYAINPLTNNRVPIYVTNFVNPDFGTGAVVGNPGASKVDREFAERYSIAIPRVVQELVEIANIREDAHLENAGPFTGQPIREARIAIRTFLEEQGSGKTAEFYSMSDWLVSRQRYWGIPIPMVYCDECGTLPVSDLELPVPLADDMDSSFQVGANTLSPELRSTPCPKCGQLARRDPDTLDCIIDAFWQYCAPTSPLDNGAIFDKEEFEYWLPVDMAFYGTDILRFTPNYQFFLYVLYELGMSGCYEPFRNVVHHEMVLMDGKKMSKSLGNTVDVDEILREFGADALRMTVMMSAKPQKALNWSVESIRNAARMLGDLWSLAMDYSEIADYSLQQPLVDFLDLPKKWQKRLRAAISQATSHMESSNYHLVAASADKLLGFLTGEFAGYVKMNRQEQQAFRGVLAFGLDSIIRMLSPITPHICEELGEYLGSLTPTSQRTWPTVDSEILQGQSVS